MSQEMMIVIFALLMLVGIVTVLTTKEEKKNKTGIVKFVKTYDRNFKNTSHSPTIHLTHFIFDVDGKEYSKVVNTLKCDRQLREQMAQINKEMDYLEVYRTNIFIRTPYFHKIEVPDIEKMQ